MALTRDAALVSAEYWEKAAKETNIPELKTAYENTAEAYHFWLAHQWQPIITVPSSTLVLLADLGRHMSDDEGEAT